MASFEKLLRFKNIAGETFYGEVGHMHTLTRDTLLGLSIPVFRAGDPWDSDFHLTGKKETIAEVCPLTSAPLPRHKV
jgi:hypothetical protein